MELVELVKEYYDKRGLKWPSFDDAMKFVLTEIGEVYELDLARIGGYKRNHPENKPQFSKEALAEELGDTIFMLLVAGLVEGVNPLEAMENKMRKRLDDFRIKQEKKDIYLTPKEIPEIWIGDGTVNVDKDGKPIWK